MDKDELRRLMSKLKSADVTHVKVELEADFGRGCDDTDDCYDCGGSGEVLCVECDGDGSEAREDDDGSIYYTDCTFCNGFGEVACPDCDGEGVYEGDCSTFDDVDYCEQFILDNVDTYARRALTYIRFYNDGSVDSEVTFTLPVERIHHIPKFVKAFRMIGDETGQCDVSGAGIHIAALPEGNYPSDMRFDEQKMDNFRAQTAKLLPALYFLGTANAKTRHLNYRLPRVSRGEKYSAIYTHGDRAIEYRVFDTCYDNPSRVLDYLAVIGKTLEYYIDPDKKAPDLKQTFVFPSNSSDMSLARFYKSNEKNLAVLERQLPLLLPSHKTVQQAKIERNFKLDRKTIRERRERRKEQLIAEVRRYVDNVDDLPMSIDLPLHGRSSHTIRV